MEAAGCAGKQRFINGVEAHAHLRMLKARKPRGRMNAYPCRTCGGYHVGTKGRSSEAERVIRAKKRGYDL